MQKITYLKEHSNIKLGLELLTDNIQNTGPNGQFMPASPNPETAIIIESSSEAFIYGLFNQVLNLVQKHELLKAVYSLAPIDIKSKSLIHDSDIINQVIATQPRKVVSAILPILIRDILIFFDDIQMFVEENSNQENQELYIGLMDYPILLDIDTLEDFLLANIDSVLEGLTLKSMRLATHFPKK